MIGSTFSIREEAAPEWFGMGPQRPSGSLDGVYKLEPIDLVTKLYVPGSKLPWFP